MKYLKFFNGIDALNALNKWSSDNSFPSTIGHVAVDMVGEVRKPLGTYTQVGEERIEDTTPIEGFWVYLSESVPELAQYEVVSPEYIARVFAGFDLPVVDLPTVKVLKCTPAQGLISLYALKGITEEDIKTAIENIPDNVQRYTAKIAFERSVEWEAGTPTFSLMQDLLGLTNQEVEDLFEYAIEVSA